MTPDPLDAHLVAAKPAWADADGDVDPPPQREVDMSPEAVAARRKEVLDVLRSRLTKGAPNVRSDR